MFAYCLNNPVNGADANGARTMGIGLNINFNIFYECGYYGSIGLFVDDKGHLELQYSNTELFANETGSVGLADIGAGFFFQETNRETIYDLYGKSTSIGASGGANGGSAGVDIISFGSPEDLLNGQLDGIQFNVGVGVGFDVHMIVADTSPARVLNFLLDLILGY